MGRNGVLIYDADCAFCRRCVDIGTGLLDRFPEVVGFQFADLAGYGVTRQQAEKSIYLWRSGSQLQHGAAAVAAILLAQRGFGWRLLGGLMSVPPLNAVAEAGYRVISRVRHRLPGGTPACRVPASLNGVTERNEAAASPGAVSPSR